MDAGRGREAQGAAAPEARPVGVEIVDLGELSHGSHRQDAGGPAGGKALHGEDIHAVGRGDGAEFGRHVLAAHGHARHARLGGNGEEVRQGGGLLDQDQEAGVADRHTEGGLAVRHQFCQQADMLRAHDLGQHQGGDARHDGGGDVRHGEVERAVDADHDVGPAPLWTPLGDSRHGRGHGGPRR